MRTPFPCQRLDPNLPTGLILGGWGGPDRPTSVEPFLRNIFRDRNLLPLPPPLARAIGFLLARRRAEEVRRRYEAISPNGSSPLLGWTRQQCSQLSYSLNQGGYRVHAAPAMNYWDPFPEQTVADLLARSVRQFLVVAMFPQFSEPVSGGILRRICRVLERRATGLPVHVVVDWHLLPGYLGALASQAEPVLRGWHRAGIPAEECGLLFAARSVPERFVLRGDPFLTQTHASVAAVHQQLSTRLGKLDGWWRRLHGGPRPLLAFQGRIGPVRWLGPDPATEIQRLATLRCRRLLVIPVSFACENLGTLYDIDRRLASVAQQAGITEFARVPALNLNSGWLLSLADFLAMAAFGKRLAQAATG